MRKGQAKGQPLDPIARWEPDNGSEVLLMDTFAMTIHLGVSGRTVRRYEPVACDVATRAPLWDAEDVTAKRQAAATAAATSDTRAHRHRSGRSAASRHPRAA